MNSPVTDAFLAAAIVAAGLVAAPEVAARWDEPSALAGMTTGALAAHLASQLNRARDLAMAGEPPQGTEVIAVSDHYHRVAWVTSSHDDEVNASIRVASAAEAAQGAAGLAASMAATLAELTVILPAVPGGSPRYLPWTGWALTMDDFLISRMLEIVVHTDDLAVSADVAPPELPANVTGPVLGILTRLAVRRHGLAPVVRALTRAERAPATIAAF